MGSLVVRVGELLRKRFLWAGIRRVSRRGRRGAVINLPSMFREYIGRDVLVVVYEVELSEEARRILEDGEGDGTLIQRLLLARGGGGEERG